MTTGRGAGGKPVLVRALIAEASVERLDKGVLIGLAELNKVALNTTGMRPAEHGPAVVFLTGIRPDRFRLPACFC